MNSKRDGALRELFREGGYELCLNFVNEFYLAVKSVFEDGWFLKDDKGKVLGVHTPQTSRLIHSAGVTSLGHIMDACYTYKNCRTKGQFVDVLTLLKLIVPGQRVSGTSHLQKNIGKKFKTQLRTSASCVNFFTHI